MTPLISTIISDEEEAQNVIDGFRAVVEEYDREALPVSAERCNIFGCREVATWFPFPGKEGYCHEHEICLQSYEGRALNAELNRGS